MLRVEIFTGASAFETLQASWQELVEAASDATPFQTFEWQNTWFRHFGSSKTPLFFTVYDGNDLVGLMPLTLSRGAWRSLRAMGTGASDYLHPIAQTGYEQSVAEIFHDFLKTFRDADLIDLHQIRQTHWLNLTESPEIFAHANCLVLDLPETYDAYLATLGKSLRYDVRRLDKNLFASGKATIEYATPENIGDSLRWLFDMHEKRWRKRGLPGAFVGKKIPSFHHDWAAQAIQKDKFWLGILKLEGQPIGGIYAMAQGQTCYFYQAGFDPSQGAISPGTLLVAQTIRRAIEEGKTQFDFLRGDEGYKRRWKPQHEWKNLRLIMAKPGLRGALGLGMNRQASKVEAVIRAKLEK